LYYLFSTGLHVGYQSQTLIFLLVFPSICGVSSNKDILFFETDKDLQRMFWRWSFSELWRFAVLTLYIP